MKSLGLLASLLLVSCSAQGPTAETTAPEATAPHTAPLERPNILFVLTDDMRSDELRRVKSLAWLRRRGVTFAKSFVTNSVCCPSRTTALTGKYSHNHGVMTNERNGGGYDAYTAHGVGDSTLPLWLRGAGYRTALFGKFVNGYVAEHPPRGFDAYSKSESGARDPELGTEAAAFAERNREHPVFVALWLKSPHGPLGANKRFEATHDGERLVRVPSFDEADISEKAAWVGELPRLTPKEERAIREHEETRLEMLEGVGVAVRRVLGAMGEDTFVVFTSDNGYLLGEHRIPEAKKLPYEESIRVPLVIAGPGILGGVARDELVANNDLAPTIAEWAGVEAPEVDGRSLVPLLSRATVEGWRGALLSEHPGSGQRRPGHAVLITPEVRYIEWTSGERELYDLSTDPHQLNNIAAKTDSETLSQYSRRLKALENCAGDSCRTVEGAP